MVQLALGGWLPGHCPLRSCVCPPQGLWCLTRCPWRSRWDSWQGIVSMWPVWQENERLEGLLAPCLPWGWQTYFQRCLVQRMLMIFLPRLSPTSAASQTSTACSVCGPGMPTGQATGVLVVLSPPLSNCSAEAFWKLVLGDMRVCGAKGRTRVLCND